MTAPEWQRVREVFERALDVAPGERAAFLERACGSDAELRREVESLLAEHETPDGVLDETRARGLASAVEALAGRTTERFALAAGAIIDGKYRVEALVGRGGMGEDYRAHDLRLGRDVAVKVLPVAVAADPDRVRRFAQEARAAGRLNHPNVVAVYDTGEHEGAPYVVSELLDGESLRERLRRGPVPARRALELGADVARGLAAAHAKGIVHRDLKPENVFVTKDERAKVLDFGLAKLVWYDSDRPDAESTLVGDPTGSGVVMGTVGYMSPEQLRAEPVDHRSDVFAFGAVLYEMLAGRPAFRRATPAETMSAILNDDPPPLGEGDGRVPRGAELVVRRCLEKSPGARFQSTDDLAFEVASLADASWTGSGARSGSRPRGVWRRRLRRSVPALAALAILALPIAAYVAGRSSATAPTPSFHRLTFRRGGVYTARFTPDGQTIVYDAAWAGSPLEVFSTRASGTESRSLGLGEARIAAVSSTGELAILLGRRFGITETPTDTLARVPLAGGAPREVLENVAFADWSPDGRELAVVHRAGERDRVEYPIGRVLYEGAAGTVGCVRVSPKGDLLAFVAWSLVQDPRGSVVIVDLAGKVVARTREWPVALNITWSPSGDEVWFSAGETGMDLGLYAISLTGEQRTLARVPGALRILDALPDGRALLTRASIRAETVGLAPGESRERDLSWLDWTELVGLSDDGRTILTKEKGEGGGAGGATYVRKTDGSPAVRLGDGYALALSPDGRRALVLRPASPADLVLYPTGAGQPVPLDVRPIASVESAAWFPDGRTILIRGSESGRAVRSYAVSADGGAPVAVTPEGVIGWAVSPDGRDVLGFDDARAAYFRYPVDGGEPLPVDVLQAGEQPIRWSADGRAVYAFRPGELPVRVFRVDLETGERRLWRELMPPDPAGVDGVAYVKMTPDGTASAYSYIRVIDDLYLAEGLPAR
jgi:serine/threonine protein kinase